jgi:hypothetical protein
VRRRPYGTGQLYQKNGNWYGRWRDEEGRRFNRRIGPVEDTRTEYGLTKRQAEKALWKLRDEEEQNPINPLAGQHTVNDACEAHRRRLAYIDVSESHFKNCERKQRLHIGPVLGDRLLQRVTRHDVERLGESLIAKGLSPKMVRNILNYLNAVYEHAVDMEWTQKNPVRKAERPRSRSGDSNPDIQFLGVEELEAVIRAIPDDVVFREPKSWRKGRDGPSPPPPPDVLGPVLRVMVRTAAMTGLRQSELIGLRWRDIDWGAQRLRVRRPIVRIAPIECACPPRDPFRGVELGGDLLAIHGARLTWHCASEHGAELRATEAGLGYARTPVVMEEGGEDVVVFARRVSSAAICADRAERPPTLAMCARTS